MTLTIDVEYGFRTNATIKSALFEGSLENLGNELWHSDQVLVSSGGDKIWNVTLTAPASEALWKLTVFTYYLEAGEWKYYPASDTSRGPGVAQMEIKVASLASLEIQMGSADIPVTVDGSTKQTSSQGNVVVQLPVGGTYQVSTEQIVSIDDSTRLVFLGWRDGTNSSQRSVLLDGETSIAGTFKRQYLLRVSSPVSAYDNSTWYDSGVTVTLTVSRVVPMTSFLGGMGLRYVFTGWTGDVQSRDETINVTMDQPKAISADFGLDYTPIVIPTIVAVGILGAVILVILRSRRRPEVALEAEPAAPATEEAPQGKPATKFCDGCGEPVEEGWEHCTHCGRALGPAEAVEK
jgi:hypothetical protein